MREKELSTRVIFVRHGQTDFPTDRIYCDDREDPPLNQAGLEQARWAAGMLRGQSIDVIYASPSRRTMMTANEIAQLVGLPITEDGELRERRFGIWDGLSFKEIEDTYPEEYRAWRADMAGYTPEGGEAIEGLLGRVVAVIERAVKIHQGKTILVVSHVGPVRVALTYAMKIPIQWYRQLRIDYGSLTRVDYGRSQNNLIYTNMSKLVVDS